MAIKSKSINELLGGTGTSPISTAFSAFQQYQTVMQGIEDREYLREQRNLKKQKLMVTSIKGAANNYLAQVQQGNIEGAKKSKGIYEKGLKNLPANQDLSVITELESMYNNVKNQENRFGKIETIDNYFDDVLLDDPTKPLHIDNLSKITDKKKLQGVLNNALKKSKTNLEQLDKMNVKRESLTYKKAQDSIEYLSFLKANRGNDGILVGKHHTKMSNDWKSWNAGNKSSDFDMNALERRNELDYKRLANSKQAHARTISSYLGKITKLQEGEDFIDDNYFEEISGNDSINNKDDAIKFYRDRIEEEERLSNQYGTGMQLMEGDFEYQDTKRQYSGSFSLEGIEDEIASLKQMEKTEGFEIKYDGKKLNLNKVSEMGLPLFEDGTEMQVTQFLDLMSSSTNSYNAFIDNRTKNEQIAKANAEKKKIGESNLNWLSTLNIDVPQDKLAENMDAVSNYKKQYDNVVSQQNKKEELLEKQQVVRDSIDRFKVLENGIKTETITEEEEDELVVMLDDKYRKLYDRANTTNKKSRVLNQYKNNVLTKKIPFQGNLARYKVKGGTSEQNSKLNKLLRAFDDNAQKSIDNSDEKLAQLKRQFLKSINSK